jgi:hypothetical protein
MKSITQQLAESMDQIKVHGEGAVKLMNEAWTKAGKSEEARLAANEQILSDIARIPTRKHNGTGDNGSHQESFNESGANGRDDDPSATALEEAFRAAFPSSAPNRQFDEVMRACFPEKK